MKSKISFEQAEKLASKYKADPSPVSNFLCTLPENTSLLDDLANLEMDARLYKWQGSTIKAIREGIMSANKRLTISK